MLWWVRNLKHKELYKRYNLQEEPKTKRANFIARVNRYWYGKQEAINPKSLQWSNTKNYIWEEWRVCNWCSEYLEYKHYVKTKSTKSWYTGRCKKCTNDYKKIYRREKRDHYLSLKKARKKLEPWTRILFYSPLDIYVVVEYEYWKSHLLKNNQWLYKRFDPSNTKEKWKKV
jgi:hypothetical protein